MLYVYIYTHIFIYIYMKSRSTEKERQTSQRQTSLQYMIDLSNANRQCKARSPELVPGFPAGCRV